MTFVREHGRDVGPCRSASGPSVIQGSWVAPPGAAASSSSRARGCPPGCDPTSGDVVDVASDEPVNQAATPVALAPWQFDLYVEAEADGDATAEQLAVLEADRAGWREALLQRLVRESEEHVVAARSISGDERDQVLADAQSDHRRLSAAWDRFNGDRTRRRIATPSRPRCRARCRPRRPTTRPARTDTRRGAAPGLVETGTCRGVGRGAADAPAAGERRGDRDARRSWCAGGGVDTARRRPDAEGAAAADAFAAPRRRRPGLAGRGRSRSGRRRRRAERPMVGATSRSGPWSSPPGARWFRCCASDAAAPEARAAPTASFAVRWTPTLIDARRLKEMADDMPGSVRQSIRASTRRALTRSALTGMVDAICRDSARRIEVPAAPPTMRTANDVTEAFLARLDGSAFEAPMRVAGDLVTRTADWAHSVTRDHTPLVVRLDPPDRGNAWELEVFASGANRAHGPDRARDRQRARRGLGSPRPRRRAGPPRTDARRRCSAPAPVVAARWS